MQYGVQLCTSFLGYGGNEICSGNQAVCQLCGSSVLEGDDTRHTKYLSSLASCSVCAEWS